MSLPSAAVAWAPAHVSPAYNAVNPRTTLHSAPSTPSMGSDPSKGKKVDWTPGIREYVRRAFDESNAIPGISSLEMQQKLKETISFYAERDAHAEVHWPTYPLPQELLQEERRKAALVLSPGGPANGITNGLHLATLNDPVGSTNSHTALSRKRKSQDADDLQAEQTPTSLPPWRKTNLESRMTYAAGPNEKRQKKNALNADATSKFEQAELEKRRQRFQLGHNGNAAVSGSSHSDEYDIEGPVVGTCEKLEKSFFRLTAPPKAETVRPLHILKETLSLLQRKWKTEKNYNYICNQFKSLRQDLTVQHIKNAFTVKVYEIHARISLEKGDLGEYNQCQTQLKALYALGIDGCPAEFKAYRILYFVYTCNKTDMNDMLAELTLADKAQKWIKHALDVRSALALGNYHKYFRLYLESQNMGGYLMDMSIERERLNALANISRGYANVALRFLTDELGFDNDESCREFLESHGAQSIIEAKDGQYRVKIREAASHFEGLRAAAYSKVDIKGQI